MMILKSVQKLNTEDKKLRVQWFQFQREEKDFTTILKFRLY